MLDFIEYVVAELKLRRLSKENASNLIKQFYGNSASASKASMIHPLLHRNTSDIHEQCYRSSFVGDEFFLSDHRVADADGDPLRVLPGVAYLEMARAAVADALPDVANAGHLHFSDIVWIKPIVVVEPKEVFIALSIADSSREDAPCIEFEIFSKESAGEEVVHCRGSATRVSGEAPARIDIAGIKYRATDGEIDAGVIYPAYHRMGMRFGPAHEAVSRVHRGQGEVIAQLALPSTVGDTLAAYTLHPSLMDGALQASIGLLSDLQQAPGQPSLPFALESMRVFSGCKQEMFAWIRQAKGSSESITRLDIDLCDDQGNICVQFRGFTSRALSTDVRRQRPSEQTGLVLASPVWKPAEIVNVAGARAAQHHVLLCDLLGVSVSRLQESMPDVRLHHLLAESRGIAEHFTEAALSCFHWVREIIDAKTPAGVFIHILAPDALDANLLIALSGLLKSAALESRDVQGQLLLVEDHTAADTLVTHLQAEYGQQRNAVVRYREGVREALAWQEIHESAAAPAVSFKEGGVYLITGGLGGLGTLFAKEILRQTVAATVVLTGRAELSDGGRERLQTLGTAGVVERRVEYRKLDVTDATEVRQLVLEVKATHGGLNGVIHSAGMIADNFIAKKTVSEFARVLAPKVHGAVNLDVATHDVDLDFLVLFSSGASVTGNVGQSDYAVANGFLDQFSDQRNRMVAEGRRKGRTIAINWPLWQDGGMRMPAREQETLRETLGMHSLQTATGMRAFHRCLHAETSQAIVIEGQPEKIRRALFGEHEAPSASASSTVYSERRGGELTEQTRDYLRRQLASLIKLPFAKVDPSAPLEKYGIDSILAMDMIGQLERTFGSLSKTLFFEHQTIDELTGYFLDAHPSALESLFKVSKSTSTPTKAAPLLSSPRTDRKRRRSRASESLSSTDSVKEHGPIAIVGLSGRYPKSMDIEAYWESLRDGRDCITEVPSSRWNWRDYYNEDRTAEGCHYSKWGGFIEGVDEFDPLFFSIPPTDAELLDPQERLFLQHAWMAIEDAGYTRAGLQLAQDDGQTGQVGVYVGVMYGEYQLFADAGAQGKRIGIPVSYASIANRVSYVMNLHGPSMTLDTMCSSSLTAIHLACQDLKQGRTHMAIAGGVNVSIHPNKYLILSAGQYISSEGHCQSFGEGGGGYIPGEGVGAVVLKRLADAQRDGDHIYGLIKGSALNHGGKTNGYSVPNPKAQTNVIDRALQEYGVNPRHVSYVEAHGTGTKLGDPIEIAALTQAFRRHTDARQFCAIGSAKSNIGHCESAAGIAGLTKVLLQMKHQMIVPSLHSTVLNPHIDFDATPFVVNQTLRSWEQPEIDGQRVPRIAGISSFGAGGSNAHVIVEEYSPFVASNEASPEPSIVPLSARTSDQLKQKARELLAHLERQPAVIDLGSAAYTLQVGREAMDVRLAFVVDSIDQLIARLKEYGRGDLNIESCFDGQVEKDSTGMSLLSQDEDMLEAVDKWIARGKLSKIAELWVRGFNLEWRKLHVERKATLISLPTYPFAKDRYWVVRRDERHAQTGATASVLHPLLHVNNSDFFQQTYTSEFTGEEFFLADHQIATAIDGKRKILPGVACLELARAAVDLALPVRSTGQSLEIRNVAWAQPIAVDGRKRVSIALMPNGENIVDFEVQSEAGDITHCQGQVELLNAPARARLDLDALQAHMTRGRISPDAIYSAFDTMGIHYGPSFQCLATIHRGADQLLAELLVPGGSESFKSEYLLHPGLLDGALQASIGLLADLDRPPTEPSVPFALDSIVLLEPCASRMFAWVRFAEGSRTASGISKIDIDLCNEQGELCACLRGLTSRAIRATADENDVGLLLAVPAWETVSASAEHQMAAPFHRHHVVLCDLPHIDLGALQSALTRLEAEHLSLADADSVADRYRIAALACFERLQAILRSAPQQRILSQFVVADDAQNALLAGLSALIDTARLENPNLVGQVVLTGSSVDERALAQQLRASRACSGNSLFKYEDEAQRIPRWKFQDASDSASLAFRDGGVYLITGGLGGLGLLFAKEIFERTKEAVVVLTGRSELNGEKRAVVDALAAEFSTSAGRLVYRQLDLSRQEQTEVLVADIVEEFGGLTGVLHSAGMVRDGFIVNKASAEFSEVLEPKVLGTVHLDLATQRLDLDFIVLFSSVASALGNVGQADYAAANGFLDGFATYRNRQVALGRRQGKTLSIHWPLWQEGGMLLDAETLALLTKASGMAPLTTANGMRAFHRSFELGADRVLVIEGDVERLRHSFESRHAIAVAPVSAVSPTAANIDTSKLLERAQRYLIQQFSNLLKIPPHELNAKAALENYGMDSVLAMKLTNQLERSFGSLSKTLFFEYQTIGSLASYLVKAFPDVVHRATGTEQPGREAHSATTVATVAKSTPVRKQIRIAVPPVNAEDDVAIIGVAGRYPQAKDLREFWENLKAGRDSITEVPSDRWDHASFYHPERNQPGKTYSKWGGFLSGVDRFDALFFNISPKEAELIDPQERLFLETAWEAIEDAGYSKDSIAQNRVGVYVGAMWGQYELYGASSNGAGIPSSSFSSIANRVSYFFNFQGPSLALDTMCSSSLTAIHLACEEVRKGAIDVAIAGGVNVSVHPGKYLNLAQGNFASTDGRCRSFGEGGDGYVPGEGVGAVLLKPLAKAIRDGDQIYAVVKASSINHGGKTNGYTVPNPVAQGELIRETLNKAKVEPATLDYIETHGTGTSLGDPIEITGLVRAFDCIDTQEKQFCAIGSVKSNIGHLESAAGIAAVTKVLLQMKHRQLAPSLHAERLNPLIPFSDTPFYVQQSLGDWKHSEGHPRRAAVSSFGAGGSNAHLLLEEFVDARIPAHSEGRPEAFLLSARNRDTLLAYVQRTIEFLEQASQELSLADVAFTSQVGRTPMQERLVIVASSRAMLVDKLRQWLRESRAGSAQSRRSVVAIENVYEGSARDAHWSVSALIEGDAGRAFLQLTVEQRDLAKLAKLWISGMEVDWSSLYGTQRPKRVSLPTYPFARERFWINAPVTLVAASPTAHERKEMLYYRTEWNPARLNVTQPGQDAGPLLVLGADADLAAAIERRTMRPVIATKFGDDFESIIGVLASQGAMPESIVHIVDDEGEIAEQLDRGIFALHDLCKAVMKQRHKGRVRIVSLQAHSRAPHAALHPAMAGYFKSLALENPKFSWKLIGVDGAPDTESLARCLSNELRDAGWENSEVRYLNDQRQIRQLQRYAPRAIEKARATVKHNGVYIVTGGLGGLGYIFSEYLAREYGAKLVLTGRSVLDAEAQTKLAALNTHGDNVIYVQADVADPEQADAVVLAAKLKFSDINGVIHSAGIHRDSFVLNKTREEMESVLAAKVMGTLNLDRATQDEDLDLFVLFSSVAGALGSPGQCDYAFANNFMDAFAAQRQALVSTGERFGKTLSIGWPFWERGGMRISQSDIDLMARRSGLAPLPTEQGLQYWETFLQSQETQGIALYGETAKIDAYLLRGVPEATPSVSSQVQGADAQPLREATENYLKALLSEQIKLSIDRIDSEERFEAFGVDSMMIGRINADLERDLGSQPKTLFYEYATIAELAGYLMQEAPSALARRFDLKRVPASATVKNDAVAVESTTIQTPADGSEKIAIIGVHGQFPQSASLAEYWRNLQAGRDLIEPVPENRWDLDEFFDADPDNATAGKIYCKWGGFLQDFDKFDAAFFSIAPEEARTIDPQERLFIQSVWSAIEDAGYTRDSLKKRHPKTRSSKNQSSDVGVFVGVTTNTYHLLAPEEWQRGNAVTPGSLPWSIANRVSYFFDFQGPSMPVDTACSSSSVAIHLACESLKRKECQLAVAGGVNLYLHPSKYQSLCRRRMLAVDGKCRSFGAGDDGFIPGEGVGTLVLKPLAKAIEDRDHIYGVIAGSAYEHSGRSNGYSAPNPNSQAMLIERALAKAGIEPESIGYVEGHGTGTQLGDSLEVASLTQAFRKRTQKKGYCPLGSVKANAGHSESAAGIAGVAKVLLQFEHRQIAPTIHSEQVNPNIELDSSPFYLQHELTSWSAPAGQPRRAMINAFGAGGVNSCLILEEHESPAGVAREGAYLVVLSAKDGQRLMEGATRLHDYVNARKDVDLARLAYTLQVGREAMDARLAVVVSSSDELSNELSAYVAGAASSKLAAGLLEPHRKRKAGKPEERARDAALFERGDLDALARSWVEGRTIDWDELYVGVRPHRLPLPTYSFAKDRYWVSDAPVPEPGGAAEPPAVQKTAKLHPLVSRNVSTLKEVCFSSSLSVSEYYARDHRVNGESFFPGAGFLELACVNGTIAGEASVTRIKDIVWVQPLRLTTEDHLVKTFLMSNGNETEFVIVSFNDDNERVVHSEGRMSYELPGNDGDETQRRYSIDSLKARAEQTVSGADCYRQFESFGFRYGPCFRAVQELHIGRDFALSKLDLCDELKADFEQYILHPSILDGALQTVIGMATGAVEPNTPHLPFAVDEVEILQPLTQTCYVYVEHAVSADSVDSEIKQFNIRVLGENGDVRVRLNNFYVRTLHSSHLLPTKLEHSET